MKKKNIILAFKAALLSDYKKSLGAIEETGFGFKEYYFGIAEYEFRLRYTNKGLLFPNYYRLEILDISADEDLCLTSQELNKSEYNELESIFEILIGNTRHGQSEIIDLVLSV